METSFSFRNVLANVETSWRTQHWLTIANVAIVAAIAAVIRDNIGYALASSSPGCNSTFFLALWSGEP
jgi:hypothetical protein